MKICITSQGNNLDSLLDSRFGRCGYFFIVDTETMENNAIENPSTEATGGAGISTAQMIANEVVQVVLTGNCGPNAYQVLSAAGVQVITGVSGRIQDAIQAYKSGQLQAASQSNVAEHFGISTSEVDAIVSGNSSGGIVGPEFVPGSGISTSIVVPDIAIRYFSTMHLVGYGASFVLGFLACKLFQNP